MLKILLAGQGGQGVLSAGLFLTTSGLHEGREVTYLPAYGVEMRGGTANCSVTISDEPIASPLCTVPDVLIAMSADSFHRFVDSVKPGGIVFVNCSLSDASTDRSDITVYKIYANDLAIDAGDVRAANMVLVGALTATVRPVKKESILECLEQKFPNKPHLRDVNRKAFEMGMAAVSKQD